MYFTENQVLVHRYPNSFTTYLPAFIHMYDSLAIERNDFNKKNMKVKIDNAKAKIPTIRTSSNAKEEVSLDPHENALVLKLERKRSKKLIRNRHFHVVADDDEDDELKEEETEMEDVREVDFDENTSSQKSFDILPALSALTSTTPTTTTATRNNLIDFSIYIHTHYIVAKELTDHGAPVYILEELSTILTAQF
ncbi:uncharacterized protein LOC126751397 isoform X1 [Bactrocera neohumeralis]|uniref:uncharacterized protein LOC126751397 isoform X1 n=1 Tax=Bactrocera neohumeralis TaxID=98809 RepID=UPI0021652A17|nr:uncharacterized protein LOC126751397 isoform X1 [Bactrocera neohumeralis]